MIKEITPKEFALLDYNDYELIDVRTKEEFELVNIGGKLIPLDEINNRYDEILGKNKIILLCHHGRRSLIACQILEQNGLKNLYNLKGGIDRIAIDVKPDLTRY